MVSVHTHIPHGVAPRRSAGQGTRWLVLVLPPAAFVLLPSATAHDSLVLTRCVTFNFASADPAGAVPRSPERQGYGLPRSVRCYTREVIL